jgi:adenosine/AMP kinase
VFQDVLSEIYKVILKFRCLNSYIEEIQDKQITYRGADKSLVQLTSRCIFFYGENISFGASFVVYINSTNIHPIMIINRINETQNLLSL